MSIHKSRISVLQARLLSCQDTLDIMSASSTAELLRESNTNIYLRTKLSAYNETLKSMEYERDDLRSAVMDLIEKGMLTVLGAKDIGLLCYLRDTCIIIHTKLRTPLIIVFGPVPAFACPSLPPRHVLPVLLF